MVLYMMLIPFYVLFYSSVILYTYKTNGAKYDIYTSIYVLFSCDIVFSSVVHVSISHFMYYLLLEAIQKSINQLCDFFNSSRLVLPS